ncbi:MAG TPA: 2TM domain-containing protein [Gaiella sp.]|jgi:hypothetical protein
MPTETLAKNGRVAPEAMADLSLADERTLRAVARKHIEHVRRLRMHVAAFVLGMLVLTPIWLVTEYMNADGWPERFSDNSNAGDWNPWILWVALVWGFVVAVIALRTYFDRPTTEAEIQHEVERLKSRL